ncbi:T9SS type A sorting domain-containing protein [bacterium]|nr:T9SS type A sorting domain-containing protein [bacterium]
MSRQRVRSSGGPAGLTRLARVGGMGLLLWLVSATAAPALTTEQLLDDLQHTGFDYFWNEANPANGLVKDRSTSGSPASIAAVGFGLSAICIAIDHGWITHAEGADRVLTTLDTFWTGPQGSASTGFIGYKGLFYHFLDMNTATRAWTSELSTIDTALFLAGALDARQYFTGPDSVDVAIRATADSLYQRADWEFTRNSGVGIRMGWTPESGFASFGTWVGYNEAMILYILAIGSPTHPVPSSTWFTWTSGYNWANQYGYDYLNFPPLFGHQYSHCWIDYRSIQDIYMTSKAITYFENSRRATLAAREYCIDNPGGWTGYGPNLWGLTASDDPGGYLAHGAPPAQNDNGTITPTAAASSIPFAPEVVIPALHHMYDTYQAQLWGPYGFRDAFNPTVNWFATDYLGIDEGPIVIMIENYRNASVWNRFMQNADVQVGLTRIGFNPAVGIPEPHGDRPAELQLAQNFPNPFRGTSVVTYRLEEPRHVTLSLHDVSGRLVRTVLDQRVTAGPHRVVLSASELASGVYYYRLQSQEETATRRCLVIR